MSHLVKVLIVDDEELIRLNLRALMEDLGYLVAEASNGKEGLDVFNRDRPDLVLADLRMPVMDGLSMIAALRVKNPETPVIVISGTGTTRNAVDSLRMGAWDYVIKPVTDTHKFEIIIRRTLEKAELIKENRRYREHLEDLVRERTEQLLTSETRYRRLLESVTSYVYTVNLKDGLPDATVHGPGCEAVTGFTPEEYNADPYLWYRTVHDDDRPQVLDIAKRILSESPPVSLEHRIYHKNGTTRWVQNTLVPHRTAKGELNSYDGIVTNITERKQAEQALRQAEEKYRHIFENAIEGIFQSTPEGRYITVNPALAQIHGYDSPDEMIAATTSIAQQVYVNPERRDEFKRRLEEKGEVKGFEVDMHQKGGGTCYVSVSARTVRDTNGAVLYYEGTSVDIAERKRMENVLRESEERFRTLTEKSLVGIYIIQDDLFRYVNPAFAAISGLAPEEIIDKLGPADFVLPEDRALVLGPLRRSLSGETEFGHFEFHTSRKDGSIRIVEIFGAAALHHGRPAVLGTAIDITERRKSEEERLQLTERWERTFDAVPDLIAILDTDFRIVQANKAMANQLGCGPEACVGLVCYEAVHGAEAPPPHCPHTRTLKDYQDHVAEVSEERLGGDFIVSTSPIYDSAGQMIGSVHVARDITERKRAEEELRRSSEEIQDLYNNAPCGYHSLDKDGVIVRMNDTELRWLGFTPDEVIGRMKLADILTAESSKTLQGYFPLFKERGYAYDVEFEFVRKDGTVFPGLLSATAVRDKEGNYVMGRSTVYDISERKRAEEEKKRLEIQLHQAQKMEAIGTLAGGIAHDFNNLLTVMTGYGALLNMRMDEADPLKTYIDQILSACEKASSLTHGLLAFSRQQPIHPNPLGLNNVIKGTEKLLKRLITEDVTLKFGLAQEEIIIMADATQIDQILFNLATNARDAMQKGGVLTIETDLVQFDNTFIQSHGFGEPGRYALLSISDTGVGMDEKTRSHIFDPFFTTKEIGKGTGLGLSTVYGIVKQHNGYISVQSEPNKGTSFHIYLPSITAALRQEQPSSPSLKKGRETILVAEDNFEVRCLIREVLTQYGYTILEAVDGEDAIHKFREHGEIDLLIFDSVMPRKNGREAYEEISKIKPGTKVIFTSGYTRDVILEKGIEEREFNIISKPLTPNIILEKTREILDKHDK